MDNQINQEFPEIVNQLKDEDSELHYLAAFALGNLGDLRAIEPLIIALEDKDASVRFHSAEALGKLGDERALPALKKLVNGTTFKGKEAREARYKARKAIKLIENRIS